MEGYIKIPNTKEFLRNKDLSDRLYSSFIVYPELNYKNRIELVGLSNKSYNKKIKELKEYQYIRENNDINKNKIKTYINIDEDIIKGMLKGKKDNLIKVYIILIIFYRAHKDNWFTYKSLLNQIGYYNKSDSRNNKKIKDILDWLESHNLIRYVSIYNKEYNCKEFKIVRI